MNVVPAESSPVAPSKLQRTGQESGTLDSAVVSLAAATQIPPSIYALPSITLTNPSSDAISTQMVQNYVNSVSPSSPTRFQGLGSALLDRFTNSGANYAQSAQLSAPPGTVGIGSESGNGIESDIKLTVKTKSGIDVALTLESTDGGLSVGIQSSGTLSDSERKALSSLAGAFQQAIDAASAEPPKLDLTGLMKFDPSVLASVDFTAGETNGGKSVQSVAFHADSATRTVAVTNAQGSIHLSVDANDSAIAGTPQQRSAAIADYLAQFDQAAARGHADASLMTMFKDAFTELNEGSGTQTSASAAAKSSRLNDAGLAMLTGLADFSASITDTTKSVNPMHPAEVDSFSYQVSQTTQIDGTPPLDGSVRQAEQSQLSATFHTGISGGPAPVLTSQRASQSYDYVTIEDIAQSTTAFGYRQGELTLAASEQSASRSTRTQTYENGNATQDLTTFDEQSRSTDLLLLLKKLPEAQDEASRQQVLSNVHDAIALQADPAKLTDSAKSSAGGTIPASTLLAGGAGQSGGASSATSQASIRQIQQRIAQLQRQLAAVEARIAAMKQTAKSPSGASEAQTELGALQQQAASIQAALSTAEGALVQAVHGSGSASQTSGSTE
ncbi:hypothetical protein AB1286_22490 [Trinickia sp. NRRL B-1857]|uniref:hypothetical protein n=1 Tax=Trinickia sp. NRRL B-1857 TaxID=3162879 RepID=UPI003D285694